MNIRPANMRVTHGIRNFRRLIVDLSVSAVECVEETLADPLMVRESGSGMDAPEDIPTGSVKAFFSEKGESKYCFGFCQRTTTRC